MKPLQLRIDAAEADAIVDALMHAAFCDGVARPNDNYYRLAEWLSWRRTKTYGKRPAVGVGIIEAMNQGGIYDSDQVMPSTDAQAKANRFAAAHNQPLPYPHAGHS